MTIQEKEVRPLYDHPFFMKPLTFRGKVVSQPNLKLLRVMCLLWSLSHESRGLQRKRFWRARWPQIMSRTHRKRLSATHLSIDTCSTLPEYLHSDEPPEYPDSAEEADADTDSDVNFFQLPSPKTSPRRAKRFLPSHKRRHSSQHSKLPSTDAHLDSLLERSVHALEMSNTLLQSSISTQTSLSAVLALDSPADVTLEAHARNLSSRIQGNGNVQASWADDLQEISKSVEGLFRQDSGHSRRSSSRSMRQKEGPISSSLPSSSFPTMRTCQRRPSLDLRQASADTATLSSRLHYSPQSRSRTTAPPPRALTEFVVSTQDSESILLSSTLDLRSSSSLHHASDRKTVSERASSSTTSLLVAPSLPPKLTDKPLEPSTPAYTMLSSFVCRAPSSGSVTPSSSFTPSFMSRRRDSSNGSASTERGYGHTPRRRSSSPSPSDKLQNHHQDRCVSAALGCSLTDPSKRGVSPLVLHRPMTPPVEESSSSSDSCVAKRTVQSLRKILDDQASLQTNTQTTEALSPSISVTRLRAPPFLPRSPAPVAEAGTSTATASISRLLTKGKHSSSTRPPSPPLQSAMKRSPSSSTSLSPAISTPTPSNSNSIVKSPSALNFPEMVVKALGGSTSSSGMSTPSKRISFAELPESYSSTRPSGSSSKFKDKRSRKKRKSGRGGKDQSSLEKTGWWAGWLTTGISTHGLAMSLARQERLEDRITRNWDGRLGAGFSSNLEDWAVWGPSQHSPVSSHCCTIFFVLSLIIVGVEQLY